MCVLRRRVICGGLVQAVHDFPFGTLAKAKQMAFEGYSIPDTQVVLLTWWQENGFGV